MQTIRRARGIVPATFLVTVGVAVAVAVAACSSGSSIPSPVPTASGPLVTVETRGGECFAAPCGMTVILERDGRVHQAAKPPNDLGSVPPGALAALDAAIRTTDFTALKSHRFAGQCPTAYDGQEIVFEFGAAGGVQRIATCEVNVDFGQPLFVAVTAALGSFVPLSMP